MKQHYIAPEAEEFLVCTSGAILTGSEPLTTTSSGEDLTQDSEYDPW